MGMPKLQDFFGTWKLESFDIEKLDKTVGPWGQETHGLLIFSPTAHMSVSINRELEDGINSEKKIFDSILFYSGEFEIEGEQLLNKVTNASDPARIGKTMVRFVTLEGDRLTLSTRQESFGRAILRWRKIS
jgi:hypothetical protein